MELSTKKRERLDKIQHLNDASLQMLDEMFEAGDDPRAILLAKEHIETGYMWAKRSVAAGCEIYPFADADLKPTP